MYTVYKVKNELPLDCLESPQQHFGKLPFFSVSTGNFTKCFTIAYVMDLVQCVQHL